MNLLIKAFHKYSGKEGDASTLTKGELKDLLQSELAGFIGKSTDKAGIDKIYSNLDSNSDGLVDFTEYVTLVCCITTLCNDYLCGKK
ncbi:ictacalcin-like isoform X2 [Stegastes partitus]|nr:PREDICTED: ictacalcin-like isoform X2 [Stegastes partitus]XP_008303937.1 PREDICTED: ictacalcin-like isoform X2 [Stegastes partitus]XP_008303938.1 PREDICTED: ictacalcin-like isoform X2 [Stegastes partitus]XP_008303939.1 PREDICTED: ictacalcin-like isoform X2 [Stegastes partitus]XP_008303940.1 PREDICTED: ictacalcin-like isoform X2 [Stegastes partitus]XP_008303941.1 PREDICTED: ictacalcin-like isoform X2 [Stegastes partitus]XP_008303942.1 PREDICTED: ictacalcin-like isoform X2 [Stegastes partitu